MAAELAVGGLHHVALPVTDLERSTSWYESVLRASVYRRTDIDVRDVQAGRVRQVWMNVGGIVVNLAEGPAIARREDQHFFHYALVTDSGDLDEWMAHLAEQQVPALGPYGHGGMPFVSLYFDDPDSYRWELVVGFGSFDLAHEAALRHGGLLGNPMSSYRWE